MAGKNSQISKLKDSKIIVAPWITEASTQAVELNKYVFEVAKKARKEEIERAIENIFEVKVTSVNTVSIPRKARMRGRTPGFRSGRKKALVTLKEGDRIEFFEGK